MSSVTQRLADMLGGVDRLPAEIRAVLLYYGETGVFDREALSLYSLIDDEVTAMKRDSFETIEAELAREFDRESVAFEYETKLVKPAQLTLGYLFRQCRERTPEGFDPVSAPADTDAVLQADPADIQGQPDEHAAVAAVERVREVTSLAVDALIEGDIRDAIYDDEFEDFEVDFEVTEADRRRVAEIAQSTLQESVEARLEDYPGEVRGIYEWAVDWAESHQDTDDHFRELATRARDGDEDALAAIRREYRSADLDDPPGYLTDERVRDLPYLATQYERVGVLYDAMIDIFRSAADWIEIEPEFKRSIVLMTIYAQIWRDDVDDYRDDLREHQLTPVTAEYLLADDDATAYHQIREITDQYRERAMADAQAAETNLAGIGIQYITIKGNVGNLPR